MMYTTICGLILQAAANVGAATPLVALCARLYQATGEAGYADQDMVAVIHALARQA